MKLRPLQRIPRYNEPFARVQKGLLYPGCTLVIPNGLPIARTCVYLWGRVIKLLVRCHIVMYSIGMVTNKVQPLRYPALLHRNDTYHTYMLLFIIEIYNFRDDLTD